MLSRKHFELLANCLLLLSEFFQTEIVFSVDKFARTNVYLLAQLQLLYSEYCNRKIHIETELLLENVCNEVCLGVKGTFVLKTKSQYHFMAAIKDLYTVYLK